MGEFDKGTASEQPFTTSHHTAVRSALVIIVLLAVSVRLFSAIYQGDSIAALPGVHDQISYDTLARQVLAGEGFTFPVDWWPATRAGEPTAHWSYLYTLYLSVVYAAFGPHPLAARLIQAIIAGIVQPWLTWRIGARLFGAPVGLVAATITGFYAYFVYYAGSLVTEAFYCLALLWVFDIATIIAARRDSNKPNCQSRARAAAIVAKPWLLLGLALGTAILLRQVFLLFVPILLAWLLWAIVPRTSADGKRATPRSWRPVILRLLITMVVVFLMVLPWTVRNYAAFGRPVLLNTNAGYAFFWANHPTHGEEFVPILPSHVYAELIPTHLRDLDEAALDQALLVEGLRFAVEDPARYLRLSISRIWSYFEFWPSAESSLPSNLSRVLSFGILLPFMAFGLTLSLTRLRERGRPDQKAAIILICLFMVLYTLVHLLSWALIRYRLPVDAILVLFAALGVVDLVHRLPMRLKSRLNAVAARLLPATKPPSDRQSRVAHVQPPTSSGVGSI
jgi:4-amino-4-deoxy-L-arabinose transferase-like glycosyltransferase